MTELGATLSECGTYRYDLSRRWAGGPLALWLMLNPSTADASVDDATIRRCIGFTKREGLDGLVVCNLFAYRATNPNDLCHVPDPIGPDNLRTIARWLKAPVVELVIAAWGAWWSSQPITRRPARLNVEHHARLAGHELVSLGTTADGSPRHPLRLHRATALEPFPATRA